MAAGKPSLILLGGPNGAGKSTVAPLLLRDELAVMEFVNADVIAERLSGRNSESVAIAAGRIMLRQIAAHLRRGIDFAFEGTLASRTLARFPREAHVRGYRVRLIFLWLEDPALAIARVRERVRSGGHDVPEDTIRRRYRRGIENFFTIYRPLADHWRFYDNSGMSVPRLIARGEAGRTVEVIDERTWRRARSGE
jgi:predicted ABC-type ATPase